MKRPDSPLSNITLHNRTRLITALAAFCLLTFLMGATAFMQSRKSHSGALAGLSSDAALVGEVSVTATAGTTGPTPYTTLKEAFDAINAGTHQGAITIDITATTAEGATPAVLNSSGAGSASYTSVLIRPTNDGVTIAGAPPTGRGVIELNGADNVTIDGDNPNSAGTNRNLSIQNTAVSTTTFTSVVRIALSTLITSGNNNAVKNCIITGSATGRNVNTATNQAGSEFTTYGILVGGGASTATATTPPSAIASVATTIGAGITATNFTANNNQIDACARGIAVQGAATTVANGLSVTNNTIGNATPGNTTTVYARAMTLQGFDNATIALNTVRNIEGWFNTQLMGISLGDISASGQNAVVERNTVTGLFNRNTGTFGAYGINVAAGNTNTVRNNFVSSINGDMTGGAAFSTTFGLFGIRVGTGTGHKVYHNSVNMFGARTGTAATSLLGAAFGIVATTQTGMDVRNNIFVNSMTGGTTSIAYVAVYLPSGGTTAMNLTLNNNDYFNSAAPTAQQGVGQAGTTAGTNFFTQANFDPTMTTPATNFRAYTSTLSAGGANDNATKKVDPLFVSTTDLHIAGASPMVDMGANVGVGLDIDGQARVGVPDIGADEPGGVTPAVNDIAAVAIVNPPSGSTRAAGVPFTVQASFTNNGTAAQASVPVRFKIIDSSMTTVYNQTTNVAINPGQTVTATFPNATLIAGAYTTMASSELPGDEAPANDSVSGTLNVVDPVAGGTYTVGTGGNYTSLTNTGGIFEALNVAGAGGNIVINITSDLTGETGANALNAIAGGFSVTIKPSGAARTITGTAANLSLIKLNGADNVTIDGSLSGGTDRSLTITHGNTGGTVIWIASASAADGATGNTIKNVILSGNTGTTIISGVLAGSGTTLGGDAEAPNSNNTIQNTRIFRVQNAAFLRGPTAAPLDQNWLITGNDWGSTVAADKFLFRGMLIGNAQNFTVSNNTIAGISSTTVTSSTMSGIQVALLVNGGAVTGNKISDVKHNNTTGWGSNGIYITSSSAASNLLIANNFISDVASQGFNGQADTDNGYGIVVALGGGYKIYHNSVLLNTNQGAGAAAGQTAAINILTGLAAGAVDLRDNALASTQTLGTRFGVICNSAATVFSSINYNDYFAQNVGFIGGSARATLANWQTGTGQDANSLAVDPLYITSTAPADLHLQPTSTLINAGTTVAGVTTDIDGQTRDATPDIGADEVGAAINMSIADSSTVEADHEVHSISLAVTLSSAPTQPVTVHWATAPGTATANVDYTTASGDLMFNQGQTGQEILVEIIEDTLDEGNETFFVNLTMPNGATISDGQSVVTIIDDDVNTGDFDNDGMNDPSVFRPNADNTHNAKWFVLNSNACCNLGNGAPLVTEIQFGTETDIPAAGDYDGNGSKDIAVFRPNDNAGASAFYVLNNPPAGFIKIVWGANGDIPVPGDYDGDLKTDAAVFRPSDGNWYIRKSSDGSLLVQQWGLATDRLVPSDYDADGKTDFAVVRDDVPVAGSATWYIKRSSDGGQTTQQWGFNTDKLVPTDYDVDGKTDIAVWRPSDGTFYVLRSSNGALQAQQWGMLGDVPVVGDYDGDSIADYAVWRPSNGIYFILKSSDGNYIGPIWGLPNDVPIASRYVPEQ